MYLFSLLITFIFIWKRIYDNGYYAIPKNAIVFTRNTLTNSLWAKAKKFCHKSHHLSWPLNSHCVCCALCTATNIMIILKWEKLCSKKSVTAHNLKPFLIPPKNIRICGFSSPSIISLLYNRMAKFCSFFLSLLLTHWQFLKLLEQIKIEQKPKRPKERKWIKKEAQSEIGNGQKVLSLHLMGIYVQNKQNFIWMTRFYIKLFLAFHFTCDTFGLVFVGMAFSALLSFGSKIVGFEW